MRRHLAAITLVAIAAFIVPSAADDANVTLGLLDCNVEGGMGFIIGSKKNLTCTFTSSNKGVAPENYVGVIKKLGLDIGATGRAVLRCARHTGRRLHRRQRRSDGRGRRRRQPAGRRLHQDHHLAAA